MAEKRYYWLKLKDDFFDGIKIKKLRQLAGGDTYTIIYLKMLLKAMKNDGMLMYQGAEDNICDEIALDINESSENVQVTLQYLLAKGLAEQMNDDCFLPEAVQQVGSENASAQRVREFREKQKALHAEDKYADSNEMLQCNTGVTQVKRLCNVEKEKEIEKREEVDVDVAPSTGIAPQPTMQEYQEFIDVWNSIPHTQNIEEIIPMSKREVDFRHCLFIHGKKKVLEAMEKIRNSEYLKTLPCVRWDSYMNSDVVQRLLEGAYDYDFAKKGVKTDGLDVGW